jgi:cytochrome P450
MTIEHPPVTDWTTDFDHTDARWQNDPYPIWSELRAECPMARSERFGGTWLPTSHELVSQVAYDTEHFTSRTVIVSEVRPGPMDLPAPIGLAPPITSDPPFHNVVRRMLLPAFAPKKIEALEPSTRALCNELLDQLDGRTELDAAVDYAQHIPLMVIAGMLGFPVEDADYFRRIIHQVIEGGVKLTDDDDERMRDQVEFDAYFDRQIDEHRAHPRDDLTSFLLAAELDGKPLQHELVRGAMYLLLIAGIDTTWSAIGASIWHLAQHPEHRRRLVDEPEVMPFAIEEFLRAYAPVTMARMVALDVEVAGRHLHEGDWVLLPFPSANRDPALFDRPDDVVLDREVNRHAAFGLGIHRCLGSNLARMELTVAIEEWMRRYPDFELADPGAVTWSVGQVRGPRSIPVRVRS